mgnify:CR=1 FL=1
MFFKKKKNDDKNDDFAKVVALLTHAAKIDENYSMEEEKIIKNALLKIGAKEYDIDNIIKKGREIEENSNQILEFTTEVKNMSEENKLKIVETLWQIIYSDKKADMYETNLMRRLAGLLYIDDTMMGKIKDKIKKEKL